MRLQGEDGPREMRLLKVLTHRITEAIHYVVWAGAESSEAGSATVD